MAETKVKNSQLEPHGSGMAAIVGNSTATVIDNADQWIPVQGLVSTTHLDNFTYTAGNTTTISGVADAGGGEIRVITGTNHEASIGDPIVITNTANYDGLYVVTSVPGLTQFQVTAAYVGDSLVGDVYLPDRLTVSMSDEYTLQYSLSVTAANNNDVLDFTIGINDGTVNELERPRSFSAIDQGVIAATWFYELTAGDILWLAAANTTAANNLTIQYGTWGAMGARSE